MDLSTKHTNSTNDFMIYVKTLSKSKPIIPTNPDVVLTIVGSAGVSKQEFTTIRKWLYLHVNNNLQKHGKVLVLCDGPKDCLRRFGKWKEFSTVVGRSDAYSNFDDGNNAILNRVAVSTKLQVHWEVGDHADNAIQAESSKRKKQVPLDEVFDDCGDDVSFLTVDETEQKMVTSYYESQYDDMVASDSDDNALDGPFLQSFMEGRVEERQRKAEYVDMKSLYMFLQTLPRSRMDFMELFGGKAGCTRIGIRRHLHTGLNFDLTADIDMANPENLQFLWQYIDKHRPFVVLMGPPCTAFGPWSHLNKVVAPQAWEQSLAVGLPLARLAARVATIQMAAGRHFLAENPWPSDLWKLPEWVVILKDSRVRVAYTDQCQFGLVDKAGEPTMKPTAFVASSEILVLPLRRKCPRTHTHSQLAGNLLGESKTSFAATWPVRLCQTIVTAIIKLKTQHTQSFPATTATVPCPACRQHARRDDTRHTRTGGCKFPNDISIAWKCTSCTKHHHSNHTGHTLVPGECQWAEASRRASSSRGGFPRDPRIPDISPAEEIAIADDYPEITPPPTTAGEWLPVRTQWLITELDNIRRLEGWHKLTAGPASVAFDSKFLRTPEPRFYQESLPRRSVFGFFPDIQSTYGGWWQLQDNVPSNKHDDIGYPVPILVHIFHPADTVSAPSTPFKEKPDDGLTPPSESRIIKRSPPAEARDEGDEEELPQPIQAYEPRPADEDPNEVAVNITPDWSSFDLGKAMRTMRSSNIPMIVRQLRILHLRWWHAKSAKMHAILEQAGIPKSVLDLIQGVIDTCKVCRLWQKTGRSAITSSRLSLDFNQNVQADLLFIGNLIILHMICEATRWSMTAILQGKKTTDILPAIINQWFRIWGPPETITADHEGALCSEEASIAFERWGVSFKPKPVGSHAYIVERHHELLRSQYLHIQAQCTAEQLQVTDEEVLSEATFAKNCMLQIRGKSPYQAVVGRTPKIMLEFEEQGISAIADASGGSLSRHAVRLRELAMQGMLEGTAQDRIRRAAKSSTRPSGELKDLKPGDTVDIYRTPAAKDAVGWRGPAQVIGTQNIEDGYFDVKWGGRAMSVRVADARRSLVFVTLLDSDSVQLRTIMDHLATLHETQQVFAMIHDTKGWTLSRAAREHTEIFRAGLYMGMNVFRLRCVGIRIGRGISTLRGLFGLGPCVLMWWPRSEAANYRTMSHQGTETISLKATLGEHWESFDWVQFLGILEEDAVAIRRLIDEPMLGEDPYVDPRAPEPPRVPPRNPERLNPIPEDDDMEDPDMEVDLQPPPHQPPPQPPQQPPQRPPQRPPQQQQQRSRERTPVNSREPVVSNTSTRRAVDTRTRESEHSDTSASTLPSGWKREHRKPGLEPKRRSRSTAKKSSTSNDNVSPSPNVGGTSAAASSWETPGNPTVNPVLLPVGTDSDLDDTTSSDGTVYVDPGEYYSNPRHQAPGWHDGLRNAMFNQQSYISSQPISVSPQQSVTEGTGEDGLEIEFSYHMAKLLDDCPPMDPTDVLVFVVGKKSGKTKRMIEKAFDILTTKEIRENWVEVETAFRKEVKSYKDNATYKVTRRQVIANVCSSKWVVKWKSTPEGRIVKARLTIRGFEDLQNNLSTFSSTASRWGQRVVCSVAVQRKWTMFTADVATAFLQGLTFKELAALDNTEARVIGFVPPVGSERYFQELEPSYVPWRDILELLKPAYGLKDAPKAWRTRLVQVLVSTGGTSLHTDPNLFVWFTGGLLTCILSTHVDDLKGAAVEPQAKRILKVLEDSFGKLKVQMRVFEHCGIKHEQSADNETVKLHQNHYVSQLQPMDLSTVNVAANKPLDEQQTAEYLSLLGGLSWTVQTRLDTAIYICSLQRAAKAPLAEHAARLNMVTKWAKRKPAYLTYHTLPTPCVTVVASDSAFRKEDARGLAMRGAVIGVGTEQVETPGGGLHVLEFYSRKQRRVTRSTFSAELNALSDSVEFGRMIAQTLAEIVAFVPSAADLMRMEEQGKLPVPIVAIVDARSVFDALVQDEIRPPSEVSLVMMLCQIKEAMRAGSLKRLFWVDTKDMIADGLNKGACSREALLLLGATGTWQVQFAPVGFTETVHQPIRSVKESATAVEYN